MSGGQLALPFIHEAAYDPDGFMDDASNAAARAWLAADWPTGRLALWGAPGCGKTHLLHVWAGRGGHTIVPAAALTRSWTWPEGDAAAIDDADQAPEQPLLHFLNAAAEDSRRVLLAARHPPSRWGTRLPDLASRLRATPAAEITPPGDAMLAALFASLLAARQLVVAEPVQRWLLLRLPREPAALRDAAARLDRAAMAAGRRVTQPIAAAALAGETC